ncbi:ATPase, T2SS/T4P/T4SS family [Paraburkholderia humisilvae]|uniref:ATPase, T2SS/T4P/T4SS family n=1 Tax=Paraburkholderia humisilvae TaxID=627669 RepID=UPI00362271D2
MKKINSIEFVDLYLGESFSEISGLDGVQGLVPVPEELMADVASLRATCVHFSKANRAREFSIPVGDVLYRVTMYVGVHETVFALRQPHADVRSPSALGLSDPVLDVLLEKGLRGLVVVGGEMKMGKTSTAGSLFLERVKRYGGLGFGVEDPPELNLEGRHGNGRIVQVWANATNGGYQEQLRIGLRSGAEIIFLGEIRDPDTAAEAARAGLNGHLIFATQHCEDIEGGIERLHSLAVQRMDEAGSVIAKGLAAFVWQTLDSIQPRPGQFGKRLRSKMLVVKDNDSVKTKIREGNFAGLRLDIEHQASASAWVSRKSK